MIIGTTLEDFGFTITETSDDEASIKAWFRGHVPEGTSEAQADELSRSTANPIRRRTASSCALSPPRTEGCAVMPSHRPNASSRKALHRFICTVGIGPPMGKVRIGRLPRHGSESGFRQSHNRHDGRYSRRQSHGQADWLCLRRLCQNGKSKQSRYAGVGPLQPIAARSDGVRCEHQASERSSKRDPADVAQHSDRLTESGSPRISPDRMVSDPRETLARSQQILREKLHKAAERKRAAASPM